jgi:periplasmic protein TonB
MKKHYLIDIYLIAFFSCFITSKSFSQDSIRLVKFEHPAEYPDGSGAMYRFFQSNIKYTKSVENCKNGAVYVNFCVENDGRLTEIQIQKGLCNAYNAEAKRLVSIMKKWKPATELGTKNSVKNYQTVLIGFKFD